MYSSLILLIVLSFPYVHSATILFYQLSGSYSARLQSYPLAAALADRGHDVTVLSPFPLKEGFNAHPNIREVVPSQAVKTTKNLQSKSYNTQRRVDKSMPKMYQLFDYAVQLCVDTFESVETQEYLNSLKSLDLVISINALSACPLGIVYKFQTKYIVYNQIGRMAFENDLNGFVAESWAIPEMNPFAYKTPMGFLERVENILNSIHARYIHYKCVTKMDEVVRTYMNLPGMPFLDDLARNVSLHFYPTDPITDYPRSLPPNVVTVGGIHCKNKTTSLPKEIQNFLESSGNQSGFVYISLGSVVQPATLPEEIKKSFMDTIASFPKIKFLWKWGGPFPKDTPSNLYLDKWFPQNELLAHPKLLTFVTQGGRPSLYEGLCHGVPMIIFPVITDQDHNANRMEQMGGSITLELGTVTRTELTNALNQVVNDNSRLKMRMKKLQNMYYDQPMKSLDKAVWWTEYVLRHDDLSHLRPPGFNHSWWERRLLDVWAFLFTASIITLVVLTIIFVFICKAFLMFFKIKLKTE